MHAFIQAHPDWLTEVRLPAYAPELNAAEGAWPAMNNGLGNLAVRDVDQLATVMKSRLKRIRYQPALIEGSSPRPASPSNFSHCKEVQT